MGYAFFVLKKLFRRNAVIYVPIAVNVAVAVILVYVFFTLAFNFSSATDSLYADNLAFYTVNIYSYEGMTAERAAEYADTEGAESCRVAYADTVYAEGLGGSVIPATYCSGDLALLGGEAFAAGGMPESGDEAAVTCSLVYFLGMEPDEAVGLEFTLAEGGESRTCTVAGVLGEAECSGLNAALYSDVLVPGGGDTVACVTLRFTRDADISAAIAGLDEEGADYMSDYRTLDTMRAVYDIISAVMFACGGVLGLLFALGARAAVEYTYKENILLWSLMKTFGGRNSDCFLISLLLTALPVLAGAAAGIGLGALLLAGLSSAQFALWGVPFSVVSAFSAPAVGITAGAGVCVTLLLALMNGYSYGRLDVSAALRYSE